MSFVVMDAKQTFSTSPRPVLYGVSFYYKTKYLDVND